MAQNNPFDDFDVDAYNSKVGVSETGGGDSFDDFDIDAYNANEARKIHSASAATKLSGVKEGDFVAVQGRDGKVSLKKVNAPVDGASVLEDVDDVPDMNKTYPTLTADEWDAGRESGKMKMNVSPSRYRQLQYMAETGLEEEEAGKLAVLNDITPFGGTAMTDKVRGKIARMEKFVNGKPDLSPLSKEDMAVVGPQQMMLGVIGGVPRGGGFRPVRNFSDDEQWADEARDLGVTGNLSRNEGESVDAYHKRLQGLVKEQMEKTVSRQDWAKKELSFIDKDWKDTVFGEGRQSVGYGLEFAATASFGGLVGGAAKGAGRFARIGRGVARVAVSAQPVAIAHAVSDYEKFRENGYTMRNGQLEVESRGDDPERALFKAIANNEIESITEIGLGELTAPILRGVGKVLGKRAWGKPIVGVAKGYAKIREATKFGDILFEELPEEDVQYFFSDVLGLGKKDSEYKGFFGELAESRKDGGMYTLEGQWNTALAMLLQMGGQAAVAAPGAGLEHIKNNRELANILEGAGMTKEQVAGLSYPQREAFRRFHDHFADNPEKLKEALTRFDKHLAGMSDELVRQTTFKTEKAIRDYKDGNGNAVAPHYFEVQTENGPDGKLRPKFSQTISFRADGKTVTRNSMTDPQAQVTIVDNGVDEDGNASYEIYDEIHPERSFATSDFTEAQHMANLYALSNQKLRLDNERKAEYARMLLEGGNAKYGGNHEVVGSVRDVLALFTSGMQNNNGAFHGVSDLKQIFQTDEESGELLYPPRLIAGNNSRGFATPDGTRVIILDNIRDAASMREVLSHEGSHALGKENAAERQEMLKRVSPDSELGRLTSQMMERNKQLQKPYSEEYVRDEALSVWMSQRGHNPSAMQRLSHKLFGKVGQLNDADMEVIAANAEREMSNESGEVHFLDEDYADTRTEAVPEMPTQQENQTDETRADEAPAQPAQGEVVAAPDGSETRPMEAEPQGAETPDAGVVETRRMTSAAEVISSAKTPFNEAEKAALEGASDVSGIDATDEMPANRDFLSILSKDAPVVRLNPAKVDRSDAVLPNMKKDANRTSGITKPLSGEWHPTMGGIGAAWLTKDGKLVVITGRHRSELAERKGKSMLYYLYREADGFTKDDALIYDAVANIHDEKGTINDYLGFLNRINPTREQAEKAGILSGKGLVAWSLYKDATEAVRSATAMDGNPGEGQISPQQATVIAEAAPRDADKRNPSIQRQLLKTALGGMRGKAFDMYARIRADELSKTPVNENLLVGEQMDLFSSPEDQAADILAQRQSQYRTKKAQGYQTVAQNLRAALNKEGKLELTDEYAKDLGVTDKSDKKQLEGAYEKAVERANYWENTVRLDDADKAAMDAEINAAADAKAKKLAELKAKREAAKSGKPAPKVETKPKAEAEKNSIQKPTQKEPVPRPDSAAESSALNEKQATAFAEWRKANPNAKIKSTWLKNGIVDLGYEDGSGVARQTFIEADGKRIASTPVHISWKDYDEIHGKGARRIEIESPASASVASKPAEKAPASAPAKTEVTTPAKPKGPAEAKKVASGAKPAVWPEGWDNAGEEIKGYVAPQDGDIRPRREIAIAHRSGGSINAPQKIKGVVEAVDGDNVKVYYKDGWGYDQHDTFKKSEIVGVMPSPEKPVEGKETANSTQKRVDGISSALGIPITVIGKGGKVVADSTAAAEAAVSGKQESGQSAPKPRTPSIKMKDAAAEKKAKAALDAIDFDTPELFADSTILSGDEVRKTMPGYNRLDWSTHVDRTGYVGPRLEAQFQRLLKERKGKGDGTVVFLAGGNGAGKSTAAERIGSIPDFTIDSTLGNLEVAKRQIDAILANGQVPDIRFVYRSPGQALEGIAQRVKNGGHIVSPLSFANSHVKSRENLRLLSEAYGDKIHIHIYDNSVRGVPEITLEQLEAKRKIDHARLREEANYYLGHLRDSQKERSRARAVGSGDVAGRSAGGRNGQGNSGGIAGSGAEGAREVAFDTSDFDPEKFGKLVTGVGKLVDVLVESGHKDFKALATYIYEQDAAKYERAKPVLQDIWNAVARARKLPRIADADADSTFKTIEAQTKEVEDGADTRGQHGVDAAEPATSGGEQQPGGVLADRPVREQNPDGRVDGQRSGDVSGLGDRLAEGEVPQSGGDGQRGTAEGNVSVGDKAESANGESRDERDRSEDGDKTPARIRKRAAKAADSTKPNSPRRDFVMTKAVEEAILEKKTANRVRNNLDAIKLIRELKARDYAATPEEQAALAKFVGWGGLREAVFGYDLERAYDLERSGEPDRAATLLRREGISQSAYELHKELRQVLNDKEYESAKESASTAFYTPVEFVRVLHEALRRLGVKGGRFLGPSAGTGNFASAAGAYEKPVNWQFVEKDAMTGEMLKALFPNQRVNIGGFEDTKFPDGFFDFAIDNVPYADVPINDRSLSSRMFKIHDYFFAKTLAKLRPGGVMAFLTSTGTLDKTSPILRQFLTEHGGRIVGAVRLPNGFFSENAGTDVASDLVIVQKVQGKPDNSAFEKGVEYGSTTEWVRRKGQVKKPLTYNGYFKDHPEQIVGEMTVGSGQFGPTLQYKMPPEIVPPGGKGLWEQMNDAVSRAFAGVDKDLLLKEAAVAQKQDHTPIYDDEGLRQGNVTMKDGKPFIKSGEMLEPISLPSDRALNKELARRFKSPKSIMDGLMDLRKAMRDVIDAQMADSDVMETDLAPLQAKLNETYDAFVKKNGSLHDKWISPFVMLDKADGNRLLALERIVKDESGKPKIVKSDIFTKRVISRGQRATRAETPKDALVICYSEMGGINIPRIATLLDTTAEEAIDRLKDGGDVFENPQTGLLEPSWGYLSGRVRAKLAAARAAVEAGEEGFRANVEALEKVQPPMVRLEDAEIKFGATWVDPECMADFLRDAFGSEHMRISLSKNEVTGQWNVEFGHIMNEDPWGETSWDPKEFVSRVLNHGSMNHYVTDPVDKKRYLDERRTEANKLAAEKLHSAFSQFIQSSEKWATPMYERYNAVMTDMVEIQLPNNILPFRSAGMSEDALGKLFEGGDPKTPKKGREYQSAVIARGVLGNGSLCLAHCVGAGKTLEMQSIGVLGRHLGLFKKPMYVVPNHMLEQFTNEFVEAFPNANILKMSEDDVKPENRRAFFAQVANGDWDAIVVKHSTFSKKLAMSEEYQKEFIEAQRRDLIGAIAAMREAGEKISVDQATKKLERLEAKLEQLANAENHDSQIVPFEELGVDQLFVDEAHNFKGMPITTRQGRTGGLSQGDSQRAVDMQMKAQYVQSLHGGDRGVVFATGTPLSNAPVVEAFVMLKYLAPNKLEEQGLKHFDDFVDAFGRITTESEFSLDGKTVKEKEKVSAFVNIPELMKLFRSVVDIVNPDQLDIPRPKPKYHMIDVEMSPAQTSIMEMVAHEAATPPSREERNKYLTLTRIAKNACLTPRLLGYEDGGNKIIRAVSEIKKVYDETAGNRGAQLVFTDIFNRAGAGTDTYIDGHMSAENELPRSGRDYNLNEEMRDLLVQAGIPKDEIAIIQDIDKSKGDKDANKGALFAKVRSGEVRVLIGSRPKMGEGTNVQERLAAIHLLHPGWKPAEDEQAIGRIIRFGNTYKEGQIFYYLTKGNANIGSYETKNHQLIGVKSKLIDQVMHGDDTVREIDMDESAMDRDMLMGLASGNKALMELIDVKKRVHKLELNTESTANSARRNKDKAEANSRILERRREEFAKEQEGVKEWREKNEGKPFTLSTPDGRSIEKVKDMAEYVSGEMAKLLTQDRYDRNERTVLGNFNGVELVLAYNRWGDEKFRIAVPLLGVAREINYSGFIPDFSQAAMTAFKGKIFETVSPDFAKAYENLLADMDRQAKKMSADADRLQKDYETMRGELIKLRTRQAELERAVTPLVIQTVEKRNVAAYGNWAIVKERNGHGYVAQREADAKRLTAPTVKELIPLMNAEDFANPKNSAVKTTDLMPRLKPDAKGNRPNVETLSVEQVDFDTPELTAAEEKYAASEDQTPTEEVMREVYGMTNDDIATAMKAAGMEPPKHVRKSDAAAWQQAEALLSNPSYMAKLSRAVARFPRNIADYENNALNVLFRQRQNAVNEAQSVVDGLKETLDAFAAIPKDERDTDFNEEQKKTARDYAEAKAKLAQAKALMFETGTALTRSSSEAGRRLRSNRGLIDQTDYSYAGISGEVSVLLGGADKITPEMDEKIREIAGNFASLDEAGRDLATARLKAHAEKIVQQIKNGYKMRKMVERKPGDEVKRVMRNYNDALAQIEVGAAEVGGTLVGLSDQQYPAWGKWLRAIGEFHCFENPDITEEECIKAIVEDISPFMDGVDENQVRDALTGFGHNFRQSRYDSQRLMNDLRSQSRMKRQLDWMDERNTMPPLTGLVRDEPSDTTRNLQKQVQERKKEVPDAGRDERRLKGVLESAKTRVRNRIADLERAIATGEKIPGRERTVLEDIELREMKKRKDVLQKEYDELFKTEKGMTEEQRIKFAERMLGRELEHALEDLDRARSGDFSKRPKRPGVESPTLDVLRARLAEIRGQIHDLKLAKYEFGMTPEELDAFNARKMANREKAVARLAERIVRGDLRPQKKPQPPMPPEMQKRYDELAEQMSRAHRKLADLRREAADARKPRFIRFLGDAYRFVDGVWKMASASLDFTQVGNQTGAILMAHPKLVAENFVKTISAFKSTANAEAIELELLSEPSVKEAVDNGWLRWKKVSDSSNRGDRVELFDAIDKPFTIGGKALRLTDIPYYGTAIANSDRLYATYINAASASLYSTIVNDPKLFPGGASVFQKKMLCDMINVMNGSGSLSNDNRRMLGKVFWAPGLVDSQLKRLIGYQIWHPWTASAEEDGSGTFAERLKMSRIGLGEFVRSNLAAILLGSLLMALFSTDDQKDEFAHAGVVKKLQMLVAPRIRHTQLDFTGGSVAFLRLGNRLVSGAYETATGKQAKVRDMFGEVAHFAKGRLTPLVSNLFSALSGKAYTGQDYGAAELLLSFAPISLRDAGMSIYENGIEDREWVTAFLGAGLTMFGIGKGTYRKDDYKILTNRFLESKKEYDAIDNDDLIDDQNKRLMLDSIVAENPLMRDEVREDIAADIAQIRKDEARARKDEKEGYAADTALLSDIERGKAAILEKIRRSRR